VYLPLYHEKLFPWAEENRKAITDDGWASFMSANPEPMGDNGWWMWDGPHPNRHWDTGDFLGRYFGCPDGFDRFQSLAETACDVLSRVNAYDIPILTGTADWLWFVHELAFRHSPFFLGIDQRLWGFESTPTDEAFFAALDVWDQDKDGAIRWPIHPLVHRLTEDVFISSMTAIEIVADPESAIARNEPFDGYPFYLGRGSNSKPVMRQAVSTRIVSEAAMVALEPIDGQPNRLEFDGAFWRICFPYGNEDQPIPLVNCEAGCKHLAILLMHPNRRFKATDFFGVERRDAFEAKTEAISSESQKELVLKGDVSQKRISRRQTEEERKQQVAIKEWIEREEKNLVEAEAKGDHDEVKALRERLDTARKMLATASPGTDRRGLSSKQDHDRVMNALKRVFKAIDKHMPACGGHFRSKINGDNGIGYDMPENCRWVVSISETATSLPASGNTDRPEQ